MQQKWSRDDEKIGRGKKRGDGVKTETGGEKQKSNIHLVVKDLER